MNITKLIALTTITAAALIAGAQTPASVSQLQVKDAERYLTAPQRKALDEGLKIVARRKSIADKRDAVETCNGLLPNSKYKASLEGTNPYAAFLESADDNRESTAVVCVVLAQSIGQYKSAFDATDATEIASFFQRVLEQAGYELIPFVGKDSNVHLEFASEIAHSMNSNN